MNLNLKLARKEANKTQQQVAQCANITKRTYQYYESDEMEAGVNTAILIAEALDIKGFRRFKEIFGHPTTAIEGRPKQT